MQRQDHLLHFQITVTLPNNAQEVALEEDDAGREQQG
jgi:hypothetical protein